MPGERTHAALARRGASIDEGAAAVFVDVDAYDLVERAFGFEAELARAARLDALRPALDDARAQRVLGAANARGNGPARGSRMIPEKKPEAALLGLPGRTTRLGRRMPTPRQKPRRV